jgi:hypothetical protein
MLYADAACTYTETIENNIHFYIFTGPCFKTKKPYTVKVPATELFAYRRGQLIQTAMPSVSNEDREFLMSGYSPEGWKQTFGNENDDPELEPLSEAEAAMLYENNRADESDRYPTTKPEIASDGSVTADKAAYAPMTEAEFWQWLSDIQAISMP